jgi:hypothetical protein
MTLRTNPNTLFSLYASKKDETRCVSCIGDKIIVQKILVGKPELLRKIKKLKVGGRLRMELILKGIGRECWGWIHLA